MADDTTTEDTATETTTDMGDAGKRALEAERKARAAAEKRAKEAEARIQAVEEADKSEVEKLQARVADLTKTTEAAMARADRFEVAAAKGLSLAQARRLVGDTKEELEADADELRADLGLTEGAQKKDESGKPGGRPKENLRSGASNDDEEAPVDAKKLAGDILGSAW